MDYKQMLRGMMRSLRDKHGVDPWRYVAITVRNAMEERHFPQPHNISMFAQMNFVSLKCFSTNLRRTYRHEEMYREHFKKHSGYLGIMEYLEWLRNNRHKWE